MATLQEKLAQGDRVAYSELYDACADRVGHYLLVRLGRREDAEDALQETFLRLARNRERLAKVENLEAYLFTVARNEATRMVADKARRRCEQRPLSGEELFRVEQGRAEVRELAETVAAALGQLTPELREVIALKTYSGLTFQQIAEVTGLPQGTVATRYRSALAKMRPWFARQS
jgi:RNA polymerase sigma-70 factor, ECF subfamily